MMMMRRRRMMRRRMMMKRMMRRGIATVERGRGRDIGWGRCGGGGGGGGGFTLLRLVLLAGVVGVGPCAELEVGSGARVVVSAPPAPDEHSVVGPLKLRRVRTRLWRRRLWPARKRRRRRTAGGRGRRAAGIQVRFRLCGGGGGGGGGEGGGALAVSGGRESISNVGGKNNH